MHFSFWMSTERVEAALGESVLSLAKSFFSAASMFHQTFQPRDLLVLLLLVLLEGLLSIDNALVLGLLARRLRPELRSKALTYGLLGSFVFRLLMILAAAWLLEWRIVKLLGGGYLIYVAIKHFFFTEKTNPPEENAAMLTPNDFPPRSTSRLQFWNIVGAIELTDIAFAVDSILAGIALVGPAPRNGIWHPKLWVVLAGGMIGVLLMRFAAYGFTRLLDQFPRFEVSAYLLITVVGIKLILDWLCNAAEHRLDFESPTSPAFWIFWLMMTLCFAIGFVPRRTPPHH